LIGISGHFGLIGMASLTDTSKEKMDEVSSVSLEFTKAGIACCDVLTFMTGFAKLGTAMLFGFTHFTWRRLIVLTYTLVLTRTAKFSISHLPVILNAVQNFHSDHFGLFEKTAAGYFRGCSAVNVRARPMSHQGQPYYSPAAARKRRAAEGPSAMEWRQWRRSETAAETAAEMASRWRWHS